MPHILRKAFVSAMLSGIGAGASAAPLADACVRAAQHIPARAPVALSGSDFAHRVAPLGEHDRDLAVRRELLAGNLPAFLRSLVPVSLRERTAGGRIVRLDLCVLPDYLAIGRDDDFLLMPMGLDTALAVASRFGFTLPTARIVDAIYDQAAVRLKPAPLPAGDRMRSIDYYLRHNALIRAQRPAGPSNAALLTAGHKKDLVATNRLWSVPDRVAIYGWHRFQGAPIQPLSIVHGARYADYSHGVRLIGTTVLVDGEPRSIFDVMHDARLAPLLSDEGPVQPLEALRPVAGDDPDAPASGRY